MSLFYPIDQHPFDYNESIDATVSNVFSCTIKGQSINGYNLKIYNMNNTLIYTSGNVTLGTPIFGDHTLSMTVPTGSGMVNGTIYKWIVTITSDGFSTTLDSYPSQFYCFSQCTLSISSYNNPITAASYTFTGVYSQAQNVQIQWYRWVLTDSTGAIVGDTGEIYNSSLIQYTFKGFKNGSTYTLELSGQSEDGMSCGGSKTFINISYQQSSTIIKPDGSVSYDKDAVLIQWGNAIQILGTSTGTISYTIFDNGKKAISIGLASNVVWNTNVNIPQQFTIPMICKFPVLPTGTFLILTNQLNNKQYTLAYNSGVFTFTINGTTLTRSFTMIVNSTYLICLKPTNLYIRGVN